MRGEKRTIAGDGRRARKRLRRRWYRGRDERSSHRPYDGLTPDRVLDALDSVGIRGDGRLLALNSYENRVYQVWRDDAPPVVAKFYRPARWTDAQILEEHAFVAALVEREVPAVPAIELARSDVERIRRLPLRRLRAPRRPRAGARAARHARCASVATSPAFTPSARRSRSGRVRR